jgi:hypothetical protein
MTDIDLFWLVLGGFSVGGSIMALVVAWRERSNDDDDHWWSIK